jgi:LacI family transcriptional regulator
MEKPIHRDEGDYAASPAVQFIIRTLEQRIRLGHYTAGNRLPTERALADEFQVSRTTIRRALDELSRNGLLERATGCRPLVCRPQIAQVQTSYKVRRRVGLWISANPADTGAHSTLRGIQQELGREEIDLLVDAPPNHLGLEGAIQAESNFLQRMAVDSACAGVILWYLGDERNLPQLRALRSAGVPMIFVDREPPHGFDADYVGIDNEQSAFNIVHHLISLGHRHIAHVTNIEHAGTVRSRLAGYRRALQMNGIPFRPDLILTGDFMESDEEATGRTRTELISRLLRSSDKPTAIFAVNDYYALSVISSLRSHGVRVPEDVSVAGFDDLERWIPGSAFVTTIRQPFEQIGIEAVRLLLPRMQISAETDYRRLILEAPLIIRESTAELCVHSDNSMMDLRGNPTRR